MATRRLRDFLSLDANARLRAHVWSISLSFIYGVVNALILNRAEKQVTIEVVSVCLCINLLQLVRYSARFSANRLKDLYSSRSFGSGFVLQSSYLQSIKPQRWFRTHRLTSATAVFMGVIILLGNVLPAKAVGQKVAVWILKNSDVGLIPGASPQLSRTSPAYRFKAVSEVIDKSLREQSPTDPAKLSKVKERLENTLQAATLPEDVRRAAMQEVAHLQAYETLSQILAMPTNQRMTIFGEEQDKTVFVLAPGTEALFIIGQGPMLLANFSVMDTGNSQFLITHKDSTSVVIYRVTATALTQSIGNLTWVNVTFQNSIIKYHGEPVRLGGVRFLNCQFVISQDGRGNDLLKYISEHQGEPIDAFVPSSSD
jgi:hypothetical protein